MRAPNRNQKELRLVFYVVTGVFLGAVYVVFDLVSEARIGEGTLTGALARAHSIVDHAVPLLLGGLLGVAAHSVRLRAQLARAEEAATRADALRVRLQKVERDQALWVLAAAVLHELNNPLHALGLLLDELGNTADEGAQRQLVERARAQSDRALAHLGMLRSLRNVEEPEFQVIALDRVVRALADDVGSLAAEDGLVVHVRCDEPIRANGDPNFVRTIVENLVDNSLQSLRGNGGGAITIDLAREGKCAVVRVSDDGPPLASAEDDALFAPLRSTKTRGLGLGLAIARALARAMRGDVVLDDADHKTFRLELPIGDGP